MAAPVTVYDGTADELADLRPFGMKAAYCSADCLLADRAEARARYLARWARSRVEPSS